jgi:hypothetical protein
MLFLPWEIACLYARQRTRVPHKKTVILIEDVLDTEMIRVNGSRELEGCFERVTRDGNFLA